MISRGQQCILRNITGSFTTLFTISSWDNHVHSAKATSRWEPEPNGALYEMYYY